MTDVWRSEQVEPNATNCTFDLWPAMAEYETAFPTRALTSRWPAKRGRPLSLFSDFTGETQGVHQGC